MKSSKNQSLYAILCYQIALIFNFGSTFFTLLATFLQESSNFMLPNLHFHHFW